ncbi:hypothetical protein BKH41_07775 [Helicobacter sp. 12S02232-10]|nr:hypothetical protein BKH41_07775 [Helicobacter sp. 12S02232-10]
MSIFLISNSLYADDIDEQIQKLEKENKLLELKQKQKELQAGITNQNQNDKADKANQSKNAKQNSKNGFSVGIEGNLGGVNNVIHPSDFSAVAVTATTFDLGLMGAYQHYFGQSQRHGIKVSGHLYSGFGNSWDFTLNTPIGDEKATISYIPVKIGLDVKYLWDFLERGKHTLGLNVGVGYQEDMYFGGKTNTNKNLNSIYSGFFYGVIGLHYSYNTNHQFELMWRGGGSSSKDVRTTIDNSYIDQTLLSHSYLTFNYAYRF